MSTDGWPRRRGYPERTIENRADENSGEIELLYKVQIVPDLWSIGIIGPGLELRIGHRDEESGPGWDRRPGEGDSEESCVITVQVKPS